MAIGAGSVPPRQVGESLAAPNPVGHGRAGRQAGLHQHRVGDPTPLLGPGVVEAHVQVVAVPPDVLDDRVLSPGVATEQRVQPVLVFADLDGVAKEIPLDRPVQEDAVHIALRDQGPDEGPKARYVQVARPTPEEIVDLRAMVEPDVRIPSDLMRGVPVEAAPVLAADVPDDDPGRTRELALHRLDGGDDEVQRLGRSPGLQGIARSSREALPAWAAG